MLLHAEGKKHRAKARAFHAKNQPAGGTQESNSVPVPPTDAPVSQTGEINTANGQNHSKRDLKGEERSVKRKREDQKTEEQNGQVVEAEKVDNKFEKKKKVKVAKEDVDNEIKWKKIITSILKSVSPIHGNKYHLSEFSFNQMNTITNNTLPKEKGKEIGRAHV